MEKGLHGQGGGKIGPGFVFQFRCRKSHPFRSLLKLGNLFKSSLYNPPSTSISKPSSSNPLRASAMELAVLFLVVFSSSSLLRHATAQRCDDAITFSNNKPYASCSVLPYHSASLHWNYHASNGTVDIAYRASGSPSSWVAWAINPNSTGMVGANAFLAFTNGTTGNVAVFATRFASLGVQVADVRDEELAFPVYDKLAEYSSGYYTIYASLELPGNNTTQHTVWQSSSNFRSGAPYGHPFDAANTASTSTLDFLSGQTASGGGNSRLHRKNVRMSKNRSLSSCIQFFSSSDD